MLPLRKLLISLPTNFIPPGVLDPNYVPPYRGNGLLVTIIAMNCLVYPTTIFRFTVRARSTGMEMDDWLMFVAVVSTVAFYAS